MPDGISDLFETLVDRSQHYKAMSSLWKFEDNQEPFTDGWILTWLTSGLPLSSDFSLAVANCQVAQKVMYIHHVRRSLNGCGP